MRFNALVRQLACLVVLATGTGVLGVSAWDWPISPVAIIHGFGGNAGDGFRLGDSFATANADTPVHAIASGTVVFRFQRDNNRTDGVPSPLGNFIVVQHAQGFRSVYSHLAQGSPPPMHVAQGTVVGLSGSSGIADQTGFDLRVVDMRRKRIVNPMVILPPVPDRLDPEVHALYIHGKENVPFADGLVVQPGKWRIAADIEDQGQGMHTPAPVAPYSLEMDVDGQPSTRIFFEYLAFKNGDLYLGRDYRWDFDAVYLGPFLYNLGEPVFTAGPHSLRIQVSDFAGNETVIGRHILAADDAAAYQPATRGAH